MPKSRIISVLHDTWDLNKEEPSTVAEVDALLGEDGGIVDGWNADNRARNLLPRFYRALSNALAEAKDPKTAKKNADGTDQTTTRADKSVVPVLESDIDHIERVITAADADKKEALRLQAQDIMTNLPVYAEGKREGGGRVPQTCIDSANAFFSVGMAQVEKVIAQIEGVQELSYKVGRDASGQPTPESLARGINAFTKFQMAAAQRAAEGLLKGV